MSHIESAIEFAEEMMEAARNRLNVEFYSLCRPDDPFLIRCEVNEGGIRAAQADGRHLDALREAMGRFQSLPKDTP